MAGGRGIVCVTGAGGFVASWLIDLLLSRGYTVHGTVRDPADPKNSHLLSLGSAPEKLKLFKADLLDYDSIAAAIKGCEGVFHVACPVPPGPVSNPEVELIQPAVVGTMNVLRACSEAKVRRLVNVSSVAAVYINSDWPKDQPMNESCWSDTEYCKATNNWYCFSKTVAEVEAWNHVKKSGLDVVTVCPSLVIGPLLQPTINSSSTVLIKLLKEGPEEAKNIPRFLVDVRDVAWSLVLVYEEPEAKGRYICHAYMISVQELVQTLKEIYPNYNYPKGFTAPEEHPGVSSERLLKLGLKFRPLRQTLEDTVENFKQVGILDS